MVSTKITDRVFEHQANETKIRISSFVNFVSFVSFCGQSNSRFQGKVVCPGRTQSDSAEIRPPDAQPPTACPRARLRSPSDALFVLQKLVKWSSFQLTSQRPKQTSDGNSSRQDVKDRQGGHNPPGSEPASPKRRHAQLLISRKYWAVVKHRF